MGRQGQETVRSKSKASTIQAALAVVDAGRVSVEEILAVAVGRSTAEFGRWLTRRLEDDTTSPQRIQVWKVRDFDDPVAEAAVRAMRRRYGRFAGVTSIHWGVRRKRNRVCAENAVVVHCTTKWPLKSLPRRRRLPTSIRVQVNGRRYRVPVDVKAVSPVATAQAISVAAPAASRSVWMNQATGNPTGALGAVVRDGQGLPRAVLSGHVALTAGRPLFVGSTAANAVAAGTVDRVIRDRDSDIAWTKPLTQAGSIPTLPPVGVRDPLNADVRTQVSVIVSRDFRGVTAFVEGVGVSKDVIFADGSVVNMTGLMALSRVTEGGDSGAPVLDFNRQLIGFVVAGSDYTFVIPARRALNDLEA